MIILFSGWALASERKFRLLDVEKLDLEYTHLNSANRDPYIPQYTYYWSERIALKWDVLILKYVYWNNNIHGETIQSGVVKGVGWEWELGAHLGRYFDVFYYHHSKHVLDETRKLDYEYGDRGTRNQFPVDDAYGIKLKFFQKE